MIRRIAVAVVLAATVAACGGGGSEVAAPQPVADGLVPSRIYDDVYAFHETDLPVHESFAEAGPSSLAADGRLWELRKNDRLVGVLQLTTLLPEVDLTDTDVRDSIVKQLMPTARDRYDVGDVTVWTTTTPGKSSFVWFANGMFALMTLKPGSNDDLEPEIVLDDVLDHMVAAPAWEYIYFDDGDEEL